MTYNDCDADLICVTSKCTPPTTTTVLPPAKTTTTVYVTPTKATSAPTSKPSAGANCKTTPLACIGTSPISPGPGIAC